MPSTYYVYKHTFTNGAVYFGKGKNGRAKKVGRNSLYDQVLLHCGSPDIEILKSDMNEADAYELESQLIEQARASSLTVLNRTDGMENAPLGSMPWRTLIFLDKPIADKTYLRMVHLLRPPETYSIAINIVEAAIHLQCTCDDVLTFLETPDVSPKPGFHFLSDEQLFERLPSDRKTIAKCIREYRKQYKIE